VTIRPRNSAGWLISSTALALVCLLALSGCSQLKQESKEKPPEIIVVWSAIDYSHDPLNAKESGQFFLTSLENRTLFKLNKDGEIQNDLVKSYVISQDGKKITLTLDDATFSDDVKISAVDVKATLSRIMLVGGEYAKLLSNIKGSSEAKSGSDFFGISAPSNKKVVIELVEPDPFFIYHLAHPVAGILPASSIGIKGEITSNIHSGSYVAEVISNELNATTVFKPRIKDLPIVNVVRKSLEEISARPKKADVDVVLAETEKSASFTPVSVPQLAAASWNIYVKDGSSPFSNFQFRKAVLLAMDREESLNAFGTKAIAPKSFTADTFDSIDCIESCKTDFKEAKKIIEDLYPNNKVPEITIHIENNTVQQTLAKSAVDRLNEIGIKANVVALAPGDLSNEIARGNVQLFRFGWVSDIAVGADALVASFKADSTENVSGVADAEFEKEVAQYEKATTVNGKLKASEGVQNRLKDLWLTKPVAHFHKIFTISKAIGGFSFDFYGRADMSKLKVEK